MKMEKKWAKHIRVLRQFALKLKSQKGNFTLTKPKVENSHRNDGDGLSHGPVKIQVEQIMIQFPRDF